MNNGNNLSQLILNCSFLTNMQLTSCPWGPVTANGMDLLTEIYAIYMPKIMSVGPTAVAGQAVTHDMTDGRKARKYIRISVYYSNIKKWAKAAFVSKMNSMFNFTSTPITNRAISSMGEID